MKFIRSIPEDSIFGRMEFWSIANNCEVDILFGKKKRCRIGITKKALEKKDWKDVTQIIAEQMGIPFDKTNLRGESKTEMRQTVGIDCRLIEVPEEKWQEVLEKIERLCLENGW